MRSPSGRTRYPMYTCPFLYNDDATPMRRNATLTSRAPKSHIDMKRMPPGSSARPIQTTFVPLFLCQTHPHQPTDLSRGMTTSPVDSVAHLDRWRAQAQSKQISEGACLCQVLVTTMHATLSQMRARHPLRQTRQAQTLLAAWPYRAQSSDHSAAHPDPLGACHRHSSASVSAKKRHLSVAQS